MVVVSATEPKMRTSVCRAASPSGVETPFCLTIKAGGTVWAESVAVKTNTRNIAP